MGTEGWSTAAAYISKFQKAETPMECRGGRDTASRLVLIAGSVGDGGGGSYVSGYPLWVPAVNGGYRLSGDGSMARLCILV